MNNLTTAEKGGLSMTERKMKDSGIPWIGMIPEEWEVCRLKDAIFEIGSGEAISKENLTLEGYPVLGGGGQIGLYSKFNTNNSLIVGRVGSCGCVTYIDYPTWATDNALIIKTQKSLKWLFYLLTVANLKDLNTSNAQPLLTAGKLKNIAIPLPSLVNQEAIAEWLDGKCGEIDELIEVEQKMIEELEAYRQATITEAVTHGLNPDVPMRQTNNSWISEIPEHWKICRLKDLCEYIKDGTHFSPATTSEGFPYITASDVHGIGIDFSRTKRISEKDFLMLVAAGCAPQKGDVIIVKDGATTGRTGILTSNDKCVLLSSVAMLKAICNNYWLMYLLSSDLTQDQILLSMAGSAMPRITLTKLNNFIGLWIPIDEQEKIASYLDAKCKEIDELIAVKREKIETLKQYRQSIIFEAVTGKIQIN